MKEATVVLARGWRSGTVLVLLLGASMGTGLVGRVWAADTRAVAAVRSVAGPASLDAMAQALAATLDPRVIDVLPRIDDLGARLLALRSYLRSGDRLGERWSWSEAQIAAWEGSAEQRERTAEIERVRAEFMRANPGYDLFVNPQVRSLDAQLASWNRNESVAEAATRLRQDVERALNAAPDTAAARTAALRAFLLAYTPEPLPTVAAPGLSPHGQMRAVDFQVFRGDELIAGPDSRTIASVWQQGGWAGRLQDAIRASAARFDGPLTAPAEPWHYTYTPVVVAGQ